MAAIWLDDSRTIGECVTKIYAELKFKIKVLFQRIENLMLDIMEGAYRKTGNELYNEV